MVQNIQNKLQETLESQLNLTIGNIDHLYSKIPNVDVYRLSASCYRFLDSLLQVYSDLIVEMISSPYKYKPVTFFTLDTKFFVWKAWLETTSALYRFFMLDPGINGSLPETIKILTKRAKQLYEDTLHTQKEEFKEQRVFIDMFLQIHSETYNHFESRISSIVDNKIQTESDAFNQIQSLAYEINKWMHYTTFEVLSLDRCLFGDRSVIIGSSVLTIYFETGLNLVEQFRKYGFEDVHLKFASADLAQYAYLFTQRKEVQTA